MQYINQFITHNPLWLIAIPIVGVGLIYLCRKNNLVTKTSVWSFLYDSSINPETVDASSKKINKKIYFCSLFSLSCLFLILAMPTEQNKGIVFINDTQIAENLNESQTIDFLSRLKICLDKLNVKHATLVFNTSTAPNFYNYLKTNTNYSLSKNIDNQNDVDSQPLIHCGMSYPKSKNVSFIPLYNKSDSWHIAKCIHLHGNTYELIINRSDDLSDELNIKVNGEKHKLKEPLQKIQNIINITVEDKTTKIELFPNDEFNANNQIIIKAFKNSKLISDIQLNSKTKQYLENNFHSLDNTPEILITNNYTKWNDFIGPAWLFNADNNSKFYTAKISEHNEQYLRFNALTNKGLLGHTIINWQIESLPNYYFINNDDTIFSLGNKSVVKLFPSKNKIASTLSLSAFPDTDMQIDFFQTLIHNSFKNISPIKHSIEFPSNLKKRIIKINYKSLPLKLIINCLFIFSILIFSIVLFFDRRTA